jgi:hypothetical protein
MEKDILLSTILKIVKETPNDADLGKKIRSLLQSIIDKK